MTNVEGVYPLDFDFEQIFSSGVPGTTSCNSHLVKSSRAGALVGRSWFTVSVGIFLFVIDSVLKSRGKKIAAVISGRDGVKLQL